MADDQDRPRRAEAEVYRAPGPPPGWYEEEQDEFSLVRAANVLLRHRWKIVGPALLLAVAVVVWTIVRPPTYTADASIVPQTARQSGAALSQLSGVASQFGVDLPGGEPAQSPQFYADLLVSRRLLEEAVTSVYRRDSARTDAGTGGSDTPTAAARPPETKDGQASGNTLVELYGISASSHEAAVVAAAGRLRESLTVTTNGQTGVVELAVTTPWSSVSSQVAYRLVELVNEFNNRVRRSQASAQAEFVGERLREARKELRAVEDSMERFLTRNVSWRQSPELQLEHDRLQRRVSLKQQLYTSLATRYEEARISEVQSTPVVTTVTRPQVPVQPDPARLPLKIALALLLGGIVGSLWAFAAQVVGRIPAEKTDEYREFVSLKEDALGDVRKAGHRVRRLLSGTPRESEE